MRVLLVGPPTVHLEHAEAVIRELGHDVQLVSYGVDDPRAAGCIPLVSGSSRLATVWTLVRARHHFRSLLRRHKPDLVHAHWLTGPGWVAAAAGASPLVVTAWGSDALRWTPASRSGRLLAMLVGRRAAAITYDADSVRATLSQYGVPGDKLIRLVFGVDMSRFRPGARDDRLLAKIGAVGDGPVILSPRGLDPVYRPDVVVQAFARLLEKRPATLLMRVPRGDEERFAQIREAIRDTDAERALIAYEGVTAEEVPALLRSADVMVSVPETDGSSVVLLQALACETPVIVSDIPANLEWVTAESAAIVKVGDSEALADALAATLDDLDAARSRTRRASERVREQASAAVELETLREIYGRAIAHLPRGATRTQR